jgi:hypothetical protein
MLIMFTYSFHWHKTVTNPKAWDYDPDDKDKMVYGPQAVKDEAKAKNTHANSVIADAYTMAGTAISKFPQLIGVQVTPAHSHSFL